MTALKQRVKNALDEARILILGTQVLLGFQYRAFFENGYEALPEPDRICEIVALFALLLTVGTLFLPVARHRLVEHGHDSESLHVFTMLVMRFALAPFALALTLDVGVVGDRILGSAGGAAISSLVGAATFVLLYGHLAHPRRRRAAQPEDRVEKTPLEQRIVQVLTEARVVLPGAQALLGFQLAMVLMDSFAELPFAAKVVHLASLAFIALATAVLMSPAAYHRIVDRGQDTERFHTFASRMVLLALVLLAPGFAGDVYVVVTKVGLPTLAPIAGVTVLVAFYGAWFGLSLLVRHRSPLRVPVGGAAGGGREPARPSSSVGSSIPRAR